MTKNTLVSPSKIFKINQHSENFDQSFNYRSIISKLNYLERWSRSDILYIVHQCARFFTCPKEGTWRSDPLVGKIPTLHKR